MRKILVVAGVVIALGGGAIALAAHSGRPSPPGQKFTRLEGHRTSSPKAAGGFKLLSPFRKLIYVEGPPLTVPANGSASASLACPKGSFVINGYFGTDGGIVADYSAVRANSARVWDFDVIDLTSVQGSAFFGVVCLK